MRFVGFTGHKSAAVHARLLGTRYPFDTCQMPLNCFDAGFQSFEREALPEATRRGVAAIGMKPMTGKAVPVAQGVVTPEEMLRYAMSLPVSTTVSGMDSLEKLRANVALARAFVPYTPAEMDALRQRCRGLAADGRFELYKTSLKYDNPEARQAHGFPLDTKQLEVAERMKETEGPR